MFPRRVDRIALDGPLDPDAYWPALTRPLGLQRLGCPPPSAFVAERLYELWLAAVRELGDQMDQIAVESVRRMHSRRAVDQGDGHLRLVVELGRYPVSVHADHHDRVGSNHVPAVRSRDPNISCVFAHIYWLQARQGSAPPNLSASHAATPLVDAPP